MLARNTPFIWLFLAAAVFAQGGDDWLDDIDEPTPAPSPAPAAPEPEVPEEGVTDPDETTVWTHGDRGITIRWNGLEGSLVKVHLHRNGALVAELSGWKDNTGRMRLSSGVSASWGSGDGFSVKVEDNLGTILWSPSFRILSDGSVNDPSAGTVWATGMTNVPVEWSGLQGEVVDVHLLQDGADVAAIASGLQNNGSLTLSRVKADYGTGDGYTILVEDEIGNSAESRQFSIQPINITSPERDAPLEVGQVSPEIRWRGGNVAVRISIESGGQVTQRLSDWIDNTGSFSPGEVTSSWMDGRAGRCRIVVEDDLGDRGEIPIYLSFTGESRSSAIALTNSSCSGMLADSTDFTWWRVVPDLNGKFQVRSTTGDDVVLYLYSSSGRRMVGPAVGGVGWHARRGSTYFVKVEPFETPSVRYRLSADRVYGSIENLSPREYRERRDD